MATPRDIRRLAFQTLFQLDAQGGDTTTLGSWLDSSEHGVEYTADQKAKAVATATGAFAARGPADKAISELAPAWPTHRQAAVDRTILRLAYFEMHAAGTTGAARVVLNDCIELAKEFSNDRSPAFINGVLDKVLKGLPPTTPPTAPVPGDGPTA